MAHAHTLAHVCVNVHVPVCACVFIMGSGSPNLNIPPTSWIKRTAGDIILSESQGLRLR